MNSSTYFYTGTAADAIWLMELHTATGAIRHVAKFTGLNRPTYQVLSKDKGFLYSVNESGEGLGGVSAFRILPNKELEHVNSQPSKGPGPCHICLSSDEKHLLAAGYGDGTVFSYPVLPDGSIGKNEAYFYHEGKSVHVERQTRPHAHCVVPLSDTGLIYAADLGTDKIYCYRFEDGALIKNEPYYTEIHPGAGPRHLVIDSTSKHMYLINEVDNTVTVLDVLCGGALRVKQTLSTLPEGFKDINWCSAIRMSCDESYVYASNRGHDSIAIFEREKGAGLLTLRGWMPARGRWPRDFNISEGNYLIVANQNSDSLFSYKLNKTGSGAYTGYSAVVEKPVCITFV